MGKKHKKHHKSERRDLEEVTEDDQSQGEMVVEEKVEKPLKLVLKVGGAPAIGGEEVAVYSAEESREHHEKRHKHKKKKKKKSSDRERSRHGDDFESEHKEKKRERTPLDFEAEDTNEPPAKKTLYEDDLHEKRHTLRESTRTQADPKEDSNLHEVLDYLHMTLQRKDSDCFFSYPVNDVIAPGYSSIISHPMDFSTMKTKIDSGEYATVIDYKRDFKLMCDNCMIYNHPVTVYYKAAKKLLHQGLKMMSKERLLKLKRTLPALASISEDALGLNDDDVEADALSLDEGKEKKSKQPQLISGTPDIVEDEDDGSGQEIVKSAKAAAKAAAEKLSFRNPDSHIGFLRRQKDGSTSLQILNPENSGIVSETEKVVNLGSLVGKLSSGTGGIPTFKEDRRNLVKPVTYLNYGPFGSYCPMYDSSFSTLTKEESDMVLSTYGDETCAEYATSMQDFIDDCSKGSDIVHMVDKLLNVITQGEHGKTKRIIEENQSKREAEEKVKQEEKAKEEAKKKQQEKENSQKDSKVKKEDGALKPGEIQDKLNETAGLLNQLEKVQNDRLGQKLPSHLAYVPGPSPAEAQLAEKISKGLAEITKQARPSDIVSRAAVRHAMGVTMDPVSSSPSTDNDSPAPEACSKDSEPPTPMEEGENSEEVDDENVEEADDANEDGDDVSGADDNDENEDDDDDDDDDDDEES